MTQSRRKFLCTAVASAIVPPHVAYAYSLPPTWAVDLCRDAGGLRLVRAATAEAARKEACVRFLGFICNSPEGGPCGVFNDDCNLRDVMTDLDVYRLPEMDHLTNPTGGDWLKAGFGYVCCTEGWDEDKDMLASTHEFCPTCEVFFDYEAWFESPVYRVGEREKA